ncbi:DUF3288 family protein [Synechococcus sp. CS-1332]|uniref:DUF3288 family protein n=1 Tax=Synechococcus sp. CS-1332 TaxID=2847972 RepID=UPI00223B0E80|nr:DUF3288 family protein [Synechococcus sp. CS-1332]
MGRRAMDDQNHPLHAIDRETVDRLLAVERPQEEHLVDAARLQMRYAGFPGAADIRDDLEKVLRLWGLDAEALHGRTRTIWAAGFRPGGAPVAEAVGSGFDTASDDAG